jgi:hypothetical protein
MRATPGRERTKDSRVSALSGRDADRRDFAASSSPSAPQAQPAPSDAQIAANQRHAPMILPLADAADGDAIVARGRPRRQCK